MIVERARQNQAQLGDTVENVVQILGQVARECRGGGHAQRFGRHASGIGALRVQFDGKQTGVMLEFGSGDIE